MIWDTDSALDAYLQAKPLLQRVTRHESKAQVLQEVSTGDLPFPSVSVRSAWVVLLQNFLDLVSVEQLNLGLYALGMSGLKAVLGLD